MSSKESENIRLNEINSWLKIALHSSNYQLEPASSDASFRRYFRITLGDETWILMDAPPKQENIKPFIDIARFLVSHNINAPLIKAQDLKLGFLLLSDFGNQPYLDKLNTQSADILYQSAINSLIDMQTCPVNDNSLPLYDQNLLQKEMELFPQWFLNKHLDLPAPSFLQQTFDLLINNALEQPQVFVHRDYHSRNLMHTTKNSPGIIDFQDAVIGAITYDLVSLLRDCYIAWPEDKLQQWIECYFLRAQKHGLLTNVSREQFIRWFDLMGLQRHIKVLGIFCRLKYRDGKDNYINDLPQTLLYVKQVCSKYPEFKELSDFLEQHSAISEILK